MIYTIWHNPGFTFPDQVQGSQIKIWLKEYFLIVGHREYASTVFENFGGGTYKPDGNKYEENLSYFQVNPVAGQKARLLLEIRNDKLIQKQPAYENWQLAKEQRTEKYFRLK